MVATLERPRLVSQMRPRVYEKHLRPTYYIRGYGGVVYDRKQWLQMLKRSSALTRAEAASRVGCCTARLDYLLTGEVNDPTLDVLHRLAAVYGEGIWAAWGFTPVGWLRGRVEHPIAYSGKRRVRTACLICGQPIPVQRHPQTNTCSAFHWRLRRAEAARRGWARRNRKQEASR